MHPHSGRRFATRAFTSHVLAVLVGAAGLSVAPLTVAAAQHDRHHSHLAQAAKVPAQRRSVDASAHHAGHGASAADTPAVAEFKAAHADMMRGMAVPYTGDADADFRIQMIPHHQGAIAMARVALRRAKDPWTRQLAEAVIVEQQREIAEMQAWLDRRGIAAPRTDEPQHILSASSYRQHTEEAGTRDEARGQSWAPGAGVPPAR
jgi:uncharacterized protein (DUF305 family)